MRKKMPMQHRMMVKQVTTTMTHVKSIMKRQKQQIASHEKQPGKPGTFSSGTWYLIMPLQNSPNPFSVSTGGWYSSSVVAIVSLASRTSDKKGK